MVKPGEPITKEESHSIYIGPRACEFIRIPSPGSPSTLEAQNAAFEATVPWQLLAVDLALEASEKVLAGHGDVGAAVRLVACEIDLAPPRAQAVTWHKWLCDAGGLTPLEGAVDWAAILASRDLV